MLSQPVKKGERKCKLKGSSIENKYSSYPNLNIQTCTFAHCISQVFHVCNCYPSMWYKLGVSFLVFIMIELKRRSMHVSVPSLLMISLNLGKETFLGPNFPPMTILPLSLYYKDIIKDTVNVQEYLAYIKSMQKVH